MMLNENMVNSREERSESGALNIKGVIGISILHFLFGQYHFPSIHSPFIILTALLALVFSKNTAQKKTIAFLLVMAFLISVGYKIIDWEKLNEIKSRYEFFRVFQLRFYGLFPLLWYFLFAFSASALLWNKYLKNGILAYYCTNCLCNDWYRPYGGK